MKKIQNNRSALGAKILEKINTNFYVLVFTRSDTKNINSKRIISLDIFSHSFYFSNHKKRHLEDN